jgi:hypothetical protein
MTGPVGSAGRAWKGSRRSGRRGARTLWSTGENFKIYKNNYICGDHYTAKIHGTSGSTKYLVNGLKRIHGKQLNNLAEIEHFEANFDQILTETRTTIQRQQDEMILGLSRDEAALASRYHDGIVIRTKEIDEHLFTLQNQAKSSESRFRRLGYHIQYRIASSLRSYRIKSPLKPVLRDLNKVKKRKETTAAMKPYVVEQECNRVVNTHVYVAREMTFFIGAKGEEQVIEILSPLPENYHLFNDVRLRFDPPIHWREREESIVSSQIDHIVIGPTGIFTLETKNWKPSDFETKSDKLEYQVKRSNLALWYYLKEFYPRKKSPKVRNAIVSMHGIHPTGKIGKYIDVVSPFQLYDYIHNRKIILSDDDMSKLNTLISRKVA